MQTPEIIQVLVFSGLLLIIFNDFAELEFLFAHAELFYFICAYITAQDSFDK